MLLDAVRIKEVRIDGDFIDPASVCSSAIAGAGLATSPDQQRGYEVGHVKLPERVRRRIRYRASGNLNGIFKPGLHCAIKRDNHVLPLVCRDRRIKLLLGTVPSLVIKSREEEIAAELADAKSFPVCGGICRCH